LPAITEKWIYCELELNLRIKPKKRLKRDKPDALAVPDGPNHTSLSMIVPIICRAMGSMDFMADQPALLWLPPVMQEVFAFAKRVIERGLL